MRKVVADIIMSLDGFITGPADAPGRGLGRLAPVPLPRPGRLGACGRHC